MNYEKVKLFLVFDGLLEGITQEEEDYISEEIKNHLTNEEHRKICLEMENCEIEFEELVQGLIQDFKKVLFK